VRNHMDPNDQNPAADPAATPQAPANDPQPAPSPTSDEGSPAPEPAPAEETPQVPSAPTPSDEGQPQSRQERRDQERQQRDSRVGKLSQDVKQASGHDQSQGSNSQLPQLPQYQPGQEVSPEQLQADLAQTAGAIADIKVNQQLDYRDAVHNFERDQESITKFPELNPDPDNQLYTPEIDQAIAEEYQDRAFKVVGTRQDGKPIYQLDKSIRLADIAKRHVNGARALANKMNANTNAAVDKTADEGAPRPTGAKPSETPFANLSKDEMRKRLGVHKV
jgi:hypothetical protein